MKPIKRGYNLWCIADQKGYILNFLIYQGKNEALEREFEDFNLRERIVLKLTEPYWKQSRLIFFDNYFTSIILLERLKTEQTLACGTIRSNRKGMPNNLMKDSAIARGEYDCHFSTSGIGVFITFVNAYVIYGEMFDDTDVLDVRRSIALGLMTLRSLPSRRSVSLKRAAPKTPTTRRGKQLSNTKDVRLGNRYFNNKIKIKNR